MLGAIVALGCGGGASRPPEDARVVTARDDARAGRETAAAVALRALVDDGSIAVEVRDAARLALVEIWLDHEERSGDAACTSEPAGATEMAVPLVLAARDEARADLRCLAASGHDVAGPTARIDALAQREVATCSERGGVAIEGRVARLGSAGDPCASAASALGGSAIDERLGVAPAPIAIGDVLAGAAGVE